MVLDETSDTCLGVGGGGPSAILFYFHISGEIIIGGAGTFSVKVCFYFYFLCRSILSRCCEDISLQ